MSTDVQVPPKIEMGEKQSRRRSKDTEKTHRRSANFQNKKHKYDHKFRKRSQSCSNGKFFPPYKLRKKDNFICPPTKFLLGGNITDPLNLNSLQDEEINRAMNAVTPKSSPLPTPQHRRGEVEVIIPRDLSDPLSLAAGDDDATYEAMLQSPVKRQQKKPKKKRRNHRSSSGVGSGKEDSIEGAKLDQSNSENVTEKETAPMQTESTSEPKKEAEKAAKVEEQSQKPAKRKSDGYNNRASLRKMELKERKAELDQIVSPVIPQPGAWNDRHRFRPPQRTPIPHKTQAMPNFKENNAKFQYGNYSRYYGYRNQNKCVDVRLRVFEKYKDLFRGKEVLDIGCNTGHVALAIARDFGPSRVVGIDIDKSLITVARNNIKHYVNCGREDKFFPVSMPIVYGPIDIPGVSEDKAFPHNISFVQGNYVLESDVQLAMEQPQFDVIVCLSITKWIQLNWGDAGLKRTFKRMFAQLRPGGVLILEAQSWSSYKRKNKLTPEIWNNYHNMELFPHQFSQYLLSEVGFSKCETIGCPTHASRGFQRPIKMFIKEDPSFDTPVYSANTSTHESATPKYCKYMPNRAMFRIERFNSERFRLPDSLHLQDEFSIDSKDSSSPARYFPYETPSSVNSPESGFSEGIFPRRYPPIAVPRFPEESDSNSQECGGADESEDKVKMEEVVKSPNNLEITVKQETTEEVSENLEITVQEETKGISEILEIAVKEDTEGVAENLEIAVQEETTEGVSENLEIATTEKTIEGVSDKIEVLGQPKANEDITDKLAMSIKEETSADIKDKLSCTSMISAKEEKAEDNAGEVKISFKQTVTENVSDRIEVSIKQEANEENNAEDKSSNKQELRSNSDKVSSQKEMKGEESNEKLGLPKEKVEDTKREKTIEISETRNTVADSCFLVQEAPVEKMDWQEEEKLEDSDLTTTDEPTKD